MNIRIRDEKKENKNKIKQNSADDEHDPDNEKPQLVLTVYTVHARVNHKHLSHLSALQGQVCKERVVSPAVSSAKREPTSSLPSQPVRLLQVREKNTQTTQYSTDYTTRVSLITQHRTIQMVQRTQHSTDYTS